MFWGRVEFIGKVLMGFAIILVGGEEASASQRALWVTRWDYKSPEDVRQIMNRAKEFGASDVLFQVRGEATVFYPSRIEPWAWELTGDDADSLGKDPEWDPLAVALEEAKRVQVGLHAWVNVFPGWRGLNPVPAKVDQVWVRHRSWFMLDQGKRLMRPSAQFYAFLSPGNPEVRQHLTAVIRELAENYPNLQGIHLDYVRYPAHEETGRFRDFSYDDASVKAFRNRYQKEPKFDRPEWMQFKCEQVAETIRMFRQAIRSTSPTMQLSGTFVADMQKATSETGQDPRIWLTEGLVDWVVPMAYKRSVKELKNTLEELNGVLDSNWKPKMLVGINCAFRGMPVQEILEQIHYVQEEGYRGEALFSYSVLFPNHQANGLEKKIQKIWEEDLLKEILLRAALSTPALTPQ